MEHGLYKSHKFLRSQKSTEGECNIIWWG